MARKVKNSIKPDLNIRDQICELAKWMAQGIFEKDQIIAIALLCAIAGENMFLLGPPGTAKSMVASRLKSVFKEGKAFDYLMSRFSIPDEIFGPVSISKLKNEDKYQRLTAGYLPDADVVFLDEIWKAGPSIQNTLLTVINEHIFHNGGEIVKVPMKILIAASNELPVKDEGLEALWDRFLVRMVSNCIENDSSFFRMLKADSETQLPLPDNLYLTDEIFYKWQNEVKSVTLGNDVTNAIKVLRKKLVQLENEDNNQLRYYVSDRRWRKAYRLMQTSAYLNGRNEISLTDYLLMIHCFWNDVEAIPNVLKAIVDSIYAPIKKSLSRLDRSLKSLILPQNNNSSESLSLTLAKDKPDFIVFDYFYYLIENYPAPDTYFSKWDYNSLPDYYRDGIQYYESKMKHNIIHVLVPGQLFEGKIRNASDIKKVKVMKHPQGVIIDDTPYTFRSKLSSNEKESDDHDKLSIYEKVAKAQEDLKEIVRDWNQLIEDNWRNCDNIFLSDRDIALVMQSNKEIEESIKTAEVKLNNILLMVNR